MAVTTRLLIALFVFFQIGVSYAADPEPVFTFTFTGSNDGTTFSIQGEGEVLGGPDGSVGIDSRLNEFVFGDFISPVITGPTPTVNGNSGVISSNVFNFIPLFSATGISFFNTPDTLQFNGSVVAIVGGRPASLSGTIEGISVASFNFPGITTFEQLFNVSGSPYTGNPGGGLYSFQLIFISNVVAQPGAVSATPGQPAPTPTFLLTNGGAILSAETTGLSSMGNTLSSVQNAAQNAVGDLNNRLFNARSGGTQGSGVASTLDSGTSRYLNFAQSQNIDYRVALGLADGETVDIVDTLSSGGGHPLAMVGVPAVTGSAVIAVEGGSGKNSVTDKVVIEDAPGTKYEVFSSFDYGYYDQDNLTRTYRGFEVDSYAGSAGLQYRLTDWLVAGAAYTYLNSDTNSTANLGSSDLEGNLLSGYLTAFHGNTYLDVLYSYGDFDNDISRNTLLGRTAYGDTESQSHNIAANLGHTIDVNEKFSFGPSAGLNYTTGEVDGYTERNGGLANLIYPDHDFESMIGRLGGYATFKCDTAAGLLTSQLSAGWAHEFMPDTGNVTASLETSPFALVTGNNFQSIGDYTASEERAHAGTDWLELGATTRLDIANTGFNLQLGYQGMFGRDNASGHFGSAKIGYEW